MSIFSKLLGAINLDRKSKEHPSQPENANPFVGIKVDIIKNVEQGMERQLRTRNFGIKFELTPEMRVIVLPEIAKNVSLLQDIPSQYFAEVEGMVMRAIASGGDLRTLSLDLHARCGITLERAGFIARDQNRKINAVMSRVRTLELGYTHATWLHVSCKYPRQSHVDFSGKTYEIAKGAYIDGKYIWPGSETGCGCISLAVTPDYLK